jgi:hypothetical protein
MSSIQNITEQFKGLSVEELLTIIASATAEAKKSAKTVAKAPKEAKEKKGSMPKGSVPPQLVKPRAWVNFTLNHANSFGWESFEVKGQTEPMAASVLVDGKNVFEATGKPMNNKQAMSLSKVRWDRKAGKGTREDLYKEFEAQPEWLVEAAAPKEVSAAPEVSASAACSVSEAENDLAPPEVRKSAVDKNREKQAEKEAAALKKAAEKEAEALKKAAEKEAETLRKKAEALRKKEETAAAKAAAKQPAAPKGKKAAEKVEEKNEAVPAFEHEDDGFAHPWDFKGKAFLRDYEGNMWFRTADGESGGWAGKFDRATNSIDTEAEEPELEDE